MGGAERCWLNRAALIVIAIAGALCAPAIAHATEYKGAVSFWGPISFTVQGNTVTAVKGRSSGVPCPANPNRSLDPVDFQLAAPVQIVDGKFHAEGVAMTDYNTPVDWSLDASISISRTISGKVTISGKFPLGTELCAGTFPFAAVIPPLSGRSTGPRMYNPAPTATAHGVVSFDFRRGVVRHLNAPAHTTCPDTSTFHASFESTSYRLDPIQVNRGRFRVVGDVLDDYGVVMHVVVSGRIDGHTATGTISASRGREVNGKVMVCKGTTAWRSRTASATPSPGGGAFYDIRPHRFGVPGAWKYYLTARPNSCNGGVVAVKFTVVGGASKTVQCNSTQRLGPLTPKRMYRVSVSAIRSKGAAIPLAEASVYLPGDDGLWVKCPQSTC